MPAAPPVLAGRWQWQHAPGGGLVSSAASDIPGQTPSQARRCGAAETGRGGGTKPTLSPLPTGTCMAVVACSSGLALAPSEGPAVGAAQSVTQKHWALQASLW